MSQLTPEQQQQLSDIWQLHEKAHKSEQALREAEQLASLQRTEVGSDFERELGMMIFVLSKSLAKHATTRNEFQLYLSRSFHQVLSPLFPLASDQQLARERGNAWDTVYDQNSPAQAEMIRHLQSLVAMISVISEDPELKSIGEGLIKLLTQPELFNQEDTRAALIYQVENAELQGAKESYQQFLEKFGPGTRYNQRDAATHLLISLAEREYKETEHKKLLRVRYLLSITKLSFGSMLKELKGLWKSAFRDMRLILDESRLMKEKNFDPAVLTEIRQLKMQKYIGLGHEKVGVIATGEVISSK